jgi:hypothetical protein
MHFDLESKRRQIAELEEQVNQPDFWNDPQNAAQVTKKLGTLKSEVERFENLQQRLRSILELAELAMEENDESVLPDLERELAEAEQIFRQVEIGVLLSGEHDRSNAILSITPGAGGTDAQDWAAMLARMYQRWAQRHGFEFEILDYSEGKEAGIKSFTALVKGDYAYGLLKNRKRRPTGSSVSPPLMPTKADTLPLLPLMSSLKSARTSRLTFGKRIWKLRHSVRLVPAGSTCRKTKQQFASPINPQAFWSHANRSVASTETRKWLCKF